MALSSPPGHQPLSTPEGGGVGFSVHTLCVSPIAVEGTCLKHVFFFLKKRLPRSQMQVLFILEPAGFVAAGQHIYNESREKTKFIVTHEPRDLGQVSSAPPQRVG